MDNKKYPKCAILALSISLAVLFALCLFFYPRWETNDDVGMSMVAHGYGLVTVGSPNIIFSNVLWGYLVRAIPAINGVLGYSVATMGVLVIFGAVVLYTLRKLGLSWTISIAALLLVIVRPVVFPQFTINSGLLTVGAILCWYLYAHQGNLGSLFIGCALAFGGYLIRSQEFLLVLLLALPLLPWGKLVRDQTSRIAATCLLVAISGAKLFDYHAYDGEDWHLFNDLNLARAPYTDFGAGSLLLSSPDIYQKYGYSKNDVQLITSWGVYADLELADPIKLKSMLFDIGFVPDKRVIVGNIVEAFKAVLHPSLLPIILIALIFLCARLNLRAWLVFFIFCLSIVLMGLLGRPGIIRVYYPLVVLLFISPLILVGREIFAKTYWSKCLSFLLFFVLLANLYVTGLQTLTLTDGDTTVRSQISDFPSDPVIVWGDNFPYEAAYPVLKIPASSMQYQIHGFGVFSPAPFSVAFRENQAGRGLPEKFGTDDGILILANDQNIKILGNYCSERLSGEMSVLSSERFGSMIVRAIHCVKK